MLEAERERQASEERQRRILTRVVVAASVVAFLFAGVAGYGEALKVETRALEAEQSQ